MKQVTYHVKVIGSYNEGLGYKWHIFENYDTRDPDLMYIAAIQFPNWECQELFSGDSGYVTVQYVVEGEDKWFDGKTFHQYNNTMCIFIKFKPEPTIYTTEVILD